MKSQAEGTAVREEAESQRHGTLTAGAEKAASGRGPGAGPSVFSGGELEAKP